MIAKLLIFGLLIIACVISLCVSAFVEVDIKYITIIGFFMIVLVIMFYDELRSESK